MSRRGRVYYNDQPAGEIRETDDGYEFVYDPAWLRGATPGDGASGLAERVVGDAPLTNRIQVNGHRL